MKLIEKGTNLSKKYHVGYKYVEGYFKDFSEINIRLKNRERKISQIREIKNEKAFKYTIENSKKSTEYN
jgi:hypothetical protein